MNKLLSSQPVWHKQGMGLIRIIIGLFLIYHGKEVFDAAQMKEYTGWDNFKTATFLPYLGKGSEFVCGVLLCLGMFTRITSIIIIGTFLYISFFVGSGKIWYDDQYPFMFVLMGFVFIFSGPGSFAFDNILSEKK